MDRTERFYRMLALLDTHRVVPRQRFLDELEVSPATFKRDLDYLRDRLNAPVIWDREARGYRLDPTGEGGSVAAPARATPPDSALMHLPGLWFSTEELYALLLADVLVRSLEPGLLAQTLTPLRGQIEKLLAEAGKTPDALAARVKILSVGSRPVAPSVLACVLAALADRRRLNVRHRVRARNEVNDREVSPQRFVRYRDNWYLDAWCHQREALRTFSADSILAAELTDRAAVDVPEADLDAHVSAGFGIFSGRAVAWAVLRFSPARARWIAAERWHPDQRGTMEAGGAYRLELPYAEPHELVMEILKHGSDCEVLAPESLKAAVRDAAAAILARYDENAAQ